MKYALLTAFVFSFFSVVTSAWALGDNRCPEGQTWSKENNSCVSTSMALRTTARVQDTGFTDTDVHADADTRNNISARNNDDEIRSGASLNAVTHLNADNTDINAATGTGVSSGTLS